MTLQINIGLDMIDFMIYVHTNAIFVCVLREMIFTVDSTASASTYVGKHNYVNVPGYSHVILDIK